MYHNLDVEAEIEDLEEILFALSNSKEELCVQPNQLSHRISHALPMEIEREQLVPRFCNPCEAEVKVLDLKEVYNKDQKKTLTGSEQRIVDSKVHMLVTTARQFVSIRVYVERSLEAIKKTHDTIGPIELDVSYRDKSTQEAYFSVDLDSIYKNEKGELIYWLDKVEVNVRNMWNLIIVLEFDDGSLKHFQSRTFRLRTKPRNHKNRSQSASRETQIYTASKNKHKFLKKGIYKKKNSQKQKQFKETSVSNFSLSMYSYAFDDLPTLWTNDDETPLDRIVPSLDLEDVFSARTFDF